MEQPNDPARPRIDTREVGPLVAVATKAGEGKIGCIILPAVLPRNDVVNLETQFGKAFGKLAVLASKPRTTANLRLEAGIHAAFSG